MQEAAGKLQNRGMPHLDTYHLMLRRHRRINGDATTTSRARSCRSRYNSAQMAQPSSLCRGCHFSCAAALAPGPLYVLRDHHL